MLTLPVLPVRDVVLLPLMTLPIRVTRPFCRRAVEAAVAAADQRIIVVLQLDVGDSSDAAGPLHGVGTLARVLSVHHHEHPEAADEEARPHLLVLLEGVGRVRLVEQTQAHPHLVARAELLPVRAPEHPDAGFIALRDSVRNAFAEVVQLSPTLSAELTATAAEIEDAGALADFVAETLPSLGVETRQEMLEILDVERRLERLAEEVLKERANLLLQQKIRLAVQQKVAGAQREVMLREQLKAIQSELGEGDPDSRALVELRRKLGESGMPEEPRQEALRELDRLASIPAAAAEYTVARTYLDWLVALPWARLEAQPVDVHRAAQVLDEDHFDLEPVKERILEYLAVLQLKRDPRGPLLCFVGPPGVGKTSLGRSIARALGRRFVRLSVGGMHDEAEIRGHRRTYVGALPGQVLQGLRRAGARDPVFMLDEIDKLGRDFQGDPAAALLEVLDPEQNASFRDHYLDVAFDLSKVLFITTANVLDPIPPALLDRLEVIELPGYAEEDKVAIARRYLVAAELAESGLSAEVHLRFTDEGLTEIVRRYTHEAGVRQLRRAIGAICRKQARRVAGEGAGLEVVTAEVVRARLGAPRFRVETELEERTRRPGVAVALAWTVDGGEVLFVEATRMPRDRGEFIVTGQVGPVMQESARAAWSWLRARGQRYGIDPASFAGHDVHVHVPAGAVPKDGPSAGVVIVAALASAFLDRPLRPRLAMTGEITLSGQLLPVGGIKEKVLAARRSGVREIVLPRANEAEVLDAVPASARACLELHFVATIDEAMARALGT